MLFTFTTKSHQAFYIRFDYKKKFFHLQSKAAHVFGALQDLCVYNSPFSPLWGFSSSTLRISQETNSRLGANQRALQWG